MMRFHALRGNRKSGAKNARARVQRPGTYRPRLELLEERLPPGDTVLGGLLAWTWAEPASIGLAPEGRPSVARRVSPWEAVEQFGEPRRGGRAIARSEVLSPFQGSGGGQGLSDPQGWRPGLAPLAPLGLAD